MGAILERFLDVERGPGGLGELPLLGPDLLQLLHPELLLPLLALVDRRVELLVLLRLVVLLLRRAGRGAGITRRDQSLVSSLD